MINDDFSDEKLADVGVVVFQAEDIEGEWVAMFTDGYELVTQGKSRNHAILMLLCAARTLIEELRFR